MGYQDEGSDRRESESKNGSCRSTCETELHQRLIQCATLKSKAELFLADGAASQSRGCVDSEDGGVPGMEVSTTELNGPYSMQDEPSGVLTRAIQSSCAFEGGGIGDVARDAEADRI